MSGDATPAFGAAFTINSTLDRVDANPGDGLCADAAARCTLRAAIQETNALPGADAITLPAGTYTFTIPGTGEDASATGDLDITASLTLSGAGAAFTVIDAAGLDRVLEAHSPAVVEIADVAVRNGGAVTEGGGIRSSAASLTLIRGSVSANSAVGPALSGAFGGGIWASSSLTLTDSSVVGNEVSGAAAFGGGIYSIASADFARSQVAGNLASSSSFAWGGGVFSGGILKLTDSEVSGNVAHAPGLLWGGGIYHEGYLSIDRSTVSRNSLSGEYGTSASGGGLYSRAEAVVTNSTISGNTALAPAFSQGMGIYNQLEMEIRNTTVTGNGGTYGISSSYPGLSLANSIVAGNGELDCEFGFMVSEGHNLDSDGSCSLTAPGDLPNQDPLLGPLADNGGPTPTHALLPGSPAIDGGKNFACPPTDQRGFVRITDGDGDGTAGCDIGAYEVESMAEPGPPIAVGGAAGLIDERATPAGERSASGGAPVAALAGVAAGAVAALGGGWYVRRRR